MKTHEISTLQDIAALTTEEFQRFLPDLIAWHCFAKKAQEMGFASPSMQWCDDDDPGVISGVTITEGDESARIQVDKPQ
jgi:hypothetical protein